MSVQESANRRNIAVRHYGASDPRTVALDGEWRTERIVAAIEKALDGGPPLTPAQRDRIRAQLDGAPEAGEAAPYRPPDYVIRQRAAEDARMAFADRMLRRRTPETGEVLP